jgi:hypothetical protein
LRRCGAPFWHPVCRLAFLADRKRLSELGQVITAVEDFLDHVAWP